MCGPAAIPIAMAVMSAAATAYSIDESKTQQNYAEAVAKQNADQQNAANAENYKLQNRQLNMQQLQEMDATAAAKHQQKLAVQKEVAVQRVSAGESGVAGLSIDSIFADVIREGSNNMTTLDRNQSDANAQRDVEKQALRNNTWAGIQNPSFYKGKNQMLGAGLQIGSAALSGYAAGGGTFGGGGSTASGAKASSAVNSRNLKSYSNYA